MRFHQLSKLLVVCRSARHTSGINRELDSEMSVFQRVQSQSEQQSAKNKELNERNLFEEAEKGNLVEVDRLLKTGTLVLLLNEWLALLTH